MPIVTQEQDKRATALRSVQPRPPFLHRQRMRLAIAALATGIALSSVAFLVAYIRLGHIIEERLARRAFAGTIDVFCAPRRIRTGESITLDELVRQLMRRGYTTISSNRTGWFAAEGRSIVITPGAESQSRLPRCRVEFTSSG